MKYREPKLCRKCGMVAVYEWESDSFDCIRCGDRECAYQRDEREAMERRIQDTLRALQALFEADRR